MNPETPDRGQKEKKTPVFITQRKGEDRTGVTDYDLQFGSS